MAHLAYARTHARTHAHTRTVHGITVLAMATIKSLVCEINKHKLRYLPNLQSRDHTSRTFLSTVENQISLEKKTQQ